MSFVFRSATLAVLAFVTGGAAQIQIDDPPKVLEKKPLTKEELKRQQADLLLRHARTLYGVGIISQRKDKLIEATTTLEKAIGLDPESLEIRRALIPLYASLGRNEEAMVYSRHVLDRDPHDVDTAYQFARMLKTDGRPAEAIPVLQKAVATKAAQERPEKLLFMFSDLYEMLEKKEDFAGAAKAQEGIIRTITEKREQLLYGNGFTREDLQTTLARAYERLGQARTKTKEFDKAILAFRGARETLLQSEDRAARHQAVRLNWNLSELASAQERWGEAMAALDAYLEHAPAEIEPYERKVDLLQKLGREKDVIPTLRAYAAREEYHLGLQLLLAGELANAPRFRREAETLYLALLKKNIKPEVYRGLFKLYQIEDNMKKVLDMHDEAAKVLALRDDPTKIDAVEVATEQLRAMRSVLRSEPKLVASLLPWALAESERERAREIDTWQFLAVLAARTRQLPAAERFFRQCLTRRLSPENEYRVYAGLIEVLMLAKKYDDVVSLCKSVINDLYQVRKPNIIIFESSLAQALTEKGRYDEAIIHADKAIKLTSDDSQVRQRCMKAEILARAERYNDAIRECLNIMDEFPQKPRVRMARYTLSNVYSQKGDFDKSEEQLRLILETDPDAHLANNNLGYQMADRNVNLDEAERFIRRAIEVDRAIRRESGEDGDNAAYLDSLGWVLFRKGMYLEAREWLEKAAALPDGAEDATVWDHLGDVYARLNLFGKAKESWQTALKLYETGPRRKNEARKAEVEKKLKTVE